MGETIPPLFSQAFLEIGMHWTKDVQTFKRSNVQTFPLSMFKED